MHEKFILKEDQTSEIEMSIYGKKFLLDYVFSVDVFVDIACKDYKV